MKASTLLLFMAALLFITVAPARASFVLVANSGFEDPAVPDVANTNGPPPGWSGFVTTLGVFNPSNPYMTGTDGAGTPIGGDGSQVLFLDVGGSLFQNPSSAVIAAATTYKLTTAVGRRLDMPFLDTSMSLRAGSPTGTVLASRSLVETDLGPAGALSDFSLSFDSDSFPASIGQPLFIVYEASTAPGGQAELDLVRLESVPEMSTIVVWGTMLISLTGLRRRIGR